MTCRFIRSAAPGLVVALAVLAPACTEAPTEGPGAPAGPVGLALVTVDALDTEALALYGGDVELPALQELASSGRIWKDAWTASPMTRPAVATYLTGLAPDRHGVLDDVHDSLAPDVATLGELLARHGFRTAAFPGSSLLPYSSGLLAGFEVVDAPVNTLPGPTYRIPVANDPDKELQNLEEWLATVEEDESYFFWLHVPAPLVAALAGGELKEAELKRGVVSLERDEENDRAAVAEAYAEFDRILGRVVDALRERPVAGRSALIVAGTMGNVSGGDEDPPGPGFSMREGAIRVPIVARLDPGEEAASLRPDDELVWTPDVAATFANLAGVELDGRSEGRSLLEPASPDRVVYSWSFAPADQMRWLPLVAARTAGWKRTTGYEPTTTSLDGPAVEEQVAAVGRLERAMDERTLPEKDGVPLESIRAVLRRHGLEPAPAGATVPEDAEERRAVGRWVWQGRRSLFGGRPRAALGRYHRALAIEPDNRAALFDRGMILLGQGDPKAEEVLGRAVELYPDDPELLHWYGHAIWQDSWEDAEVLLQAVLPFKPDEADVLYDLACTRSLAGDLGESERFLRAAVEAGFRQWQHMEVDPDLRNLRASGRFATVMREVGQ